MERLFSRRDFLRMSALGALGLAASACDGRGTHESPTPEATVVVRKVVDATKVVPTVEATFAPTATAISTIEAKVNATVEEEKKFEPYIFGEIDLSSSEKVDGVVLMEDAIDFGFIPSPYVEGVSDVGELYRVGDGRAFTLDTDEYGLVAMHSGLFRGEDLEAEPLRRFLEGHSLSRMFDDDERNRRMELIRGARVRLVQDEKDENFSVVDLVRIPPNDVDDFMSNASDLIKYSQVELDKSEKYMAVVFCGWKVLGEDSGANVGDYTWSRYMMVMRQEGN